MNKLLRLCLTVALLFLGSCAQKYDDSGYIPLEPDEIPTTDTLTVKLNTENGDFSKAFSYTTGKVKYKSFIGSETTDSETLKSAVSLLKLNLDESDSSFQKIILFLPLNPSTATDSTDHYEIGFVHKDFNSDSSVTYLEEVLQDTSFIKYDNFTSKYDSLDIKETYTAYTYFNNYIRWELDKDLIKAITLEDSGNTGIYIRSTNTDRIFEIMNVADEDDAEPFMRKYNLVTDDEGNPIMATDGTDSLVSAEVELSPVSDFVSLTKAKAILPESDDIIRIGGFSGNMQALYFDFEKTGLDTNTVLLTVRFVLDYEGSDSKYGILPKVNLVPIDSTWNFESPEEVIKNEIYDSEYIAEFNVKTVKDGESVDPEVGNKIYLSSIDYLFSGNPFDLDEFPGWLKDPAINHGFILKAANGEDYLSFSDFSNPRFEITYINKLEIIEEE